MSRYAMLGVGSVWLLTISLIMTGFVPLLLLQQRHSRYTFLRRHEMIRTPRHTRTRWLLAALLTLTACAAAPRTGASPSDDRAARIVAMLDASAVAWNQNDLDGFLEPYGPDATFVGSSGLVRGLPAIRERYVQSYWSSGAPGETLRFENIEVRPFGSDHALAVGEYVVTNRTTSAEGRGFFSLMLARTPAGWRIVHDHSS